jgi:RNA polymerase sigma-70 factor (ECF subfamily)
MMDAHVGEWVKRLRALHDEAAPLCDGQLLEEFRRANSEAAFAALVGRHGALVLSVCRRVLRHTQDAEDAFQATFLILARRAKTIRKVDSLAAWLHGVAFRLATKMKLSFARRRRREQQQPVRTEPELADVSVRELSRIVDEELNRLPETQRQALLLCDLKGLTQEQAAQQLGWPRGTLKSRLETGRERLRCALLRRGFGMGAALLTLCASEVAQALVPGTLKQTTVQAAVLGGAGKPIPADLISKQVLSLVQGALRSMSVSRWRLLVVSILFLALAGVGGWLYAQPTEPSRADAPSAPIRADLPVPPAAAAGDKKPSLPQPEPLKVLLEPPREAATLAAVNSGTYALKLSFANVSKETLVVSPSANLGVYDDKGEAVKVTKAFGKGPPGPREPSWTLKPGEKQLIPVNLADYRFHSHLMIGWRLPKAGTYTLKFWYQYDRAAARKNLGKWIEKEYEVKLKVQN